MTQTNKQTISRSSVYEQQCLIWGMIIAELLPPLLLLLLLLLLSLLITQINN